MASIDGALTRNISDTILLKTGAGKVYGFTANMHSSGTIKMYDGLYNSVNAYGTLTSSGACAPADYAGGILTSDATNVSDGDTVTLDTIVYRFKDTMLAAYDVKIGASAAITLDNLKAAVNATGTAGTEYFAGTLVHPTVIATSNGDTVQGFRARTIGTAGNSIATTETSAHLSFGGATMTGGVATSAATVTIDSITYTAVITLAESIGLTAVPYQVLWVTSEAQFLTNLKAAINKTGLDGTTYGTGTEVHPTCMASTLTSTTLLVMHAVGGTAGNSIATTETLANYAWGAATMANGTGPTSKLLLQTFTLPTGSSVQTFPQAMNFSTGLFVVIGGTSANITVLYN